MTRYASELTDFPELLSATAQWKKISAAIVEKDYFLTRALRALASEHGGAFVLKGGTSLTKGWNLLQRFSEDIDLLVKSEEGWGAGRRDKRLKGLQGTVLNTKGFSLAEPVKHAETGAHRTAIFQYHAISTDLPGLSKTTMLEMGYRGNTAAATSRPVRSMVAEFAESKRQAGLAEDLTFFELEVQNLTRTFVEKLFAIHSAYVLNRAERKTRHYYDLYEMSKCNEVKAFIGTPDYYSCIHEVQEFCQNSFPNQPLPDEDSFQASPALQPDGQGLKELERNWKAERDLYFGQQLPLAEVLHALSNLLPRL